MQAEQMKAAENIAIATLKMTFSCGCFQHSFCTLPNQIFLEDAQGILNED